MSYEDGICPWRLTKLESFSTPCSRYSLSVTFSLWPLRKISNLMSLKKKTPQDVGCPVGNPIFCYRYNQSPFKLPHCHPAPPVFFGQPYFGLPFCLPRAPLRYGAQFSVRHEVCGCLMGDVKRGLLLTHIKYFLLFEPWILNMTALTAPANLIPNRRLSWDGRICLPSLPHLSRFCSHLLSSCLLSLLASICYWLNWPEQGQIWSLSVLARKSFPPGFTYKSPQLQHHGCDLNLTHNHYLPMLLATENVYLSFK